MSRNSATAAIDKLVGRNIRLQRMAKGLSQSELGAHLALTFQQVQKYEKGANRVGCGRLFQIATVLKTPLNSFFEGVGGDDSLARNPLLDLVADRSSFDLVQAFQKIPDPQIRRYLIRLVEQIARSQ